MTMTARDWMKRPILMRDRPAATRVLMTARQLEFLLDWQELQDAGFVLQSSW
jgi:hypothetical protein